VTVRDVADIMEAWAPPEIAWERDSVGLQVGDPSARVRGVLVALDATEAIVAEAARHGANLIVTHHPLLYRPLRSVTPHRPEARTVTALVRRRVALFSAHTNLDFTRGGTSFALAGVLGLRAQEFLRSPYRMQSKIVTFVPPAAVDSVARAMSEAGGGVIGEYDLCSFRAEGTGTFRGSSASHPTVGVRGSSERVHEIRLEMIAPRRVVDRIVTALLRAHPYEEPAVDVYPLDNVAKEFGMGVIGELPRPVRFSAFLATVRRALGNRAPRWTGSPVEVVRRVAVCGGSGADLLEDAIAARADVFVTADVKYHAFHDAAGRIALIDAGHYETELPVVRAIVTRLRNAIVTRGQRVVVRATTQTTNPCRYGMH